MNESYVDLRLEDGIENFVSSSHNTETITSNPPLDDPQEEEK